MKIWTSQEKKTILDNFKEKTDLDISKDLNRSMDSVKKARQRMGLIKKEEVDLSEKVPHDFNGVCGIFGFCSPEKKVYVLSSYDIGKRYKSYISQIRCEELKNRSFLEDYSEKFYFVFLERCPEQVLVNRRNHYVSILNTYNKNIVSGPPDINEEHIKSIIDNTVKDGECLNFTGSLSKGKYGKIKIEGKSYSTHRLMYFNKYGEWPTLLRHTCHNTKCCNPEHLIPGSHRDNSLDSVEKDRELFEEIFLKHNGESKKIARELNITIDTASHKTKDLGLREKYGIPYSRPKKDSSGKEIEIKKYFGSYTDKDISLIVDCSVNLVKKTRIKNNVKPFATKKEPVIKYGPFLNPHIKYYVCNDIFGSCYDIVAEIFGEPHRHKHGFEDKTIDFLLSKGYRCDSLA